MPHPQRRLTDKLTAAFAQACDQQDREVATRLLDLLECIRARDAATLWATPAGERRASDYVIAARARLRALSRTAPQAAA